MNKKIDIIGVPSDLGANIRGANMGPSAVRIAGLSQALLQLDYVVFDHGDLHVPVREQLGSADKDHFLKSIASLCAELKKVVGKSLESGKLPLVIGGDHSVAMGSIAASAQYFKKQGKSVGLIWVDAHADLNNPQTSPSGNIHGMPLAALLGDGFKELVSLCDGALDPKNVVLIGLRNIDGAERDQVRKSGIKYYTMRSIDERGMHRVMQEALEMLTKEVAGIHLSFDMDAVDPMSAPGVSTPVTGGISYREAHLALEMIADTHLLCSADFVELNPIHDTRHQTAQLVVELIQSSLGKSIV